MGRGSLVLAGLEDVLLLGDLGAAAMALDVLGTSRQENHQTTSDKDLQEWVVREGETPRSKYRGGGFCHAEPEARSWL